MRVRLALRWMVGLLWLGGCGGGPSAGPAPRRTTPDLRPNTTGLDLAVVSRPTRQTVLLSLFIDAGARDASPPQVAAIAARLMAGAVGADARGVAHPDALEITLPCRRDALSSCLRALRAGLALRNPGAQALDAALLAHAGGRRRARAMSGAGEAPTLALRALLGKAAEGFFPLGEPEDDAQVTPAAVEAFLADHLGESRALLVASGELGSQELQAASAAVFRPALRARRTRAPRQLPPPTARRAIGVAPSDATAVGAAMVTPDLAMGASLTELLRQELQAAGPVTAHVTPVRGGAVTLVRLPAIDARQATDLLAWLPLPAGDRPTPPRTRPDDVWSESRALGLRWAAGPTPARGDARAAIALGVLKRQAPREDGDGLDAAAALREGLLQRLAKARAPLQPRDTDIVSQSRVSVTLPNGPQLELAQEAGTTAGVALRFAGGAADDPPTAHGRAAVLSRLAAMHCDGSSADAQRARLRQLGATLEPEVDADGWGLRMQLPAAQLEPGLRRLLRCALHPSLARGHVLDATASVYDELARDPRAQRMRAATAAALSPRSPGTIAPLGSAEGLSSLGAATLARAREEEIVGRRLSVAVVSPRPAPALLELLRLRLAGLRPGSPPPPPPQDTPLPPEGPALAGANPERLLLWQADGAHHDDAGTRAFARVVAQALLARGIAVVWDDGGDGWAAVGISATDGDEAALLATTRGAVADVNAEALARAVGRTHAAQALQPSRSRSAGGAADRARALLAQRLGLQPAELETCVRAAQALRRSPPRVLRVP